MPTLTGHPTTRNPTKLIDFWGTKNAIVDSFRGKNKPQIKQPISKPYVGKGMFGGKSQGPSWQERMAQQYGSKNPGFGYQPQSTYAEQARMAEQAARNRELGKGISWQPWKDPKTPLSSSMKGPPPGMKPGTGIAESLPAGGMGVAGAGALTAGQIARGGALITGLGIAQSAITGGMIGWGIADLINKIDPGGKEFLDDYFGKEVDKPTVSDDPITAEIELPVPPPQPIPSPSPIPVPSPIPPAPAPPSIPNAEWLLLEITYSGYQEWQQANYSYLNWTFRFDDNHYESGRSDLNYSWNLWVLSNRTNIEPRRYTIVTSGLTPYEPRLTWFSEQTVYYIFVAGIGDFVPGVNSPRNRQIFEKPEEYGIGGIFSGTDYARDWIYTPNPNPPPEQTRKSGDPYPYVGSGGQLQVSIKVLNKPQQPWTPPDTWNPPKEENDMSCDLSPVMQQLQQQKGQITTLQNTVNNLNLNNSQSIQNINSNTTTTVTNAINSINANTTSTVNAATNAINSNTASTINTATNAINSNTASVVNSATNAINSSTASTVNNAASAINSNIANLSSKLSQVGDDILAGVRSGFAALEAWLKPALNAIETAVKNLADEFAKFLEKFTKFLKWMQFDRILNLLILVSTIHNAAMLSNQLASSLISMANSLLTAGGNALGLRGVEDEPIDIGPAIGGVFQSLADGFIGKENNAELKKQWNKYNRIYQGAANLLSSIQSLNSTIIGALEIVGGNVARIGNALKKAGEINEKAFNWMNPQPFFNNPFSQMAEKAQQGISNTDNVAQEVISAQEQVEQIKKDTAELHKLISEEEKTSPETPPPVKTTAKEETAKTVSTVSPAPLLPSEKTE